MSQTFERGLFPESEQYVDALLARLPGMERLKGVMQSGASGHLSPEAPQYSRHEHSFWVAVYTHFLLARRADRPPTPHELLHAVVVAILHDIQHPAFSHVAEVCLPDIQTRARARILGSPGMALALAGLGLTPDQVAPEGGEPLQCVVKAPWPEINTDRLAYILADTGTSRAEIAALFSRLRVGKDGVVYAETLDAGKSLFDKSLRLARRWKSPPNLGEYAVLARIIERGLREGAVTEGDLYDLPDAALLARLGCHDRSAGSISGTWWTAMREGRVTFSQEPGAPAGAENGLALEVCACDSPRPMWFEDPTKIRLLDPAVGAGRRVTDADSVAKAETAAVHVKFAQPQVIWVGP